MLHLNMKGLNLGALYYFAYWDEKGGRLARVSCLCRSPCVMHVN